MPLNIAQRKNELVLEYLVKWLNYEYELGSMIRFLVERDRRGILTQIWFASGDPSASKLLTYDDVEKSYDLERTARTIVEGLV